MNFAAKLAERLKSTPKPMEQNTQNTQKPLSEGGSGIFADIADIARRFPAQKTAEPAPEQDEARYAFERLTWCLSAYRDEGLRLHFIELGPRPQIVLAYPKAFTPSERALVDGYFFKCLDLIAERAAELARPTIKLAA